MRNITIVILAFLLISACAPVNRFTTLKKLPREYAENYSMEGIKAPGSAVRRQPWIVYSDITLSVNLQEVVREEVLDNRMVRKRVDITVLATLNSTGAPCGFGYKLYMGPLSNE